MRFVKKFYKSFPNQEDALLGYSEFLKLFICKNGIENFDNQILLDKAFDDLNDENITYFVEQARTNKEEEIQNITKTFAETAEEKIGRTFGDVLLYCYHNISLRIISIFICLAFLWHIIEYPDGTKFLISIIYKIFLSIQSGVMNISSHILML